MPELGNPTEGESVERTKRVFGGGEDLVSKVPPKGCLFSRTWQSARGWRSGSLSRSEIETIPDSPA